METIPNLVSTIIPVHNRPEMLREAVQSVLDQTYRLIEIIIADDGSQDDTPKVAKEMVSQYPDIIKYVRLDKNKGPGPAREAGRLMASGEFIQYLDSDDLLRPRKFEIQVKALREHLECGAAYGHICLHQIDGIVLSGPYKWSGKQFDTLFPALLVDRWWNTCAGLYRRSVTDAVGPWSDLRWSQDWEYDARVGALKTKLIHCKEFVCDQRQHAGIRQTSPANWIAPDRARARAIFLKALYAYAIQAGVTPNDKEMQHFSRWIFMVARRCGAAGLIEDSKECLAIAKRACGNERAKGWDFRIYNISTFLIGWVLTGKITCFLLDHIGKRVPGPHTLKQSWMENDSEKNNQPKTGQ